MDPGGALIVVVLTRFFEVPFLLREIFTTVTSSSVRPSSSESEDKQSSCKSGAFSPVEVVGLEGPGLCRPEGPG